MSDITTCGPGSCGYVYICSLGLNELVDEVHLLRRVHAAAERLLAWDVLDDEHSILWDQLKSIVCEAAKEDIHVC